MKWRRRGDGVAATSGVFKGNERRDGDEVEGSGCKVAVANASQTEEAVREGRI